MPERMDLGLAQQTVGTVLLLLGATGVAGLLLRVTRGRRFPHAACWAIGLPWQILATLVSNQSVLESNTVWVMTSRGLALGLIIASMLAMGRPAPAPTN